MLRLLPEPTLFPYTTLFRSCDGGLRGLEGDAALFDISVRDDDPTASPVPIVGTVRIRLDRKSTRLNSSHRCISYAVFCLKKKSKHITTNNSIMTLYAKLTAQ